MTLIRDMINDLPGIKQDKILEGKGDTTNLDELTKLYIHNLKRKKSTTINHIIPMQAIKSPFKNEGKRQKYHPP